MLRKLLQVVLRRWFVVEDRTEFRSPSINDEYEAAFLVDGRRVCVTVETAVNSDEEAEQLAKRIFDFSVANDRPFRRRLVTDSLEIQKAVHPKLSLTAARLFTLTKLNYIRVMDGSVWLFYSAEGCCSMQITLDESWELVFAGVN
ncbi:MAG: hypothetical protein KDB27_02910 [Planctomycetales bacterium]|nr:hypothetical protein [Planctomycetales bacterium]